MRRPRLLMLLGLLALLVLWGWLVLRPKPKPLGVPTRANFERVREGMTEEEVEVILGPEGLHTERGVGICIYQISHAGPRWDRTPRHEWVEDDAVITIEYSTSKPRTVTSKQYDELRPESLGERLIRWLPWWERAFGTR